MYHIFFWSDTWNQWMEVTETFSTAVEAEREVHYHRIVRGVPAEYICW